MTSAGIGSGRPPPDDFAQFADGNRRSQGLDDHSDGSFHGTDGLDGAHGVEPLKVWVQVDGFVIHGVLFLAAKEGPLDFAKFFLDACVDIAAIRLDEASPALDRLVGKQYHIPVAFARPLCSRALLDTKL